MTPRRVDRLSLHAKLRVLVEIVEDFEAVGELDEARLSTDRLTRRVVERLLTQAVDVMAAVTTHVTSAARAVPASTYRGSFADAAEVGLITEGLAGSLKDAVGMRNLLVHEYVRVDLALIAAAVPRARQDVAEFIEQVGRWLLATEPD